MWPLLLRKVIQAMPVVEGEESVTLDLCPACQEKNRERLTRVRNFFLQELGALTAANAKAAKASKKPLDEKSLAERMKPLDGSKQLDRLIRLGREALAKKER
jgi:hypothetical protein